MFYKQLDGLRFFAVLCVIFHHIFPFYKLSKIDLGFFGVNLFFVISGFLISEILINQKKGDINFFNKLKVFFIRRILRIFPLYFLYILLCFYFVPIQTKEYFNWLISFSINFWIVLNNQNAFWFFTHLWSISVEEQFYLFWPFFILLIPIKKFKLSLITIIGIALIFRFFSFSILSDSTLVNYYLLPASIDCFGIGALLAYLKTFKNEKLKEFLSNKLIFIISIFLFILNSWFGNQFMIQIFNKLLVALIAFYIIGYSIIVENKGLIKNILENKVLAYIGKVSYGMYIYHLLVWGILGSYFNQFWSIFFIHQGLIKSFFEFLFIFICTFIISIISYEFYERHIMRLKRYFMY